MAATNGFFGSLEGPFLEDNQILDIIKQNSKEEPNTNIFVSKLGIHWVSNFDSDLNGIYQKSLFVKINDIEFQIGKTRMLELEDVKITSIKFMQNTDDTVYIDYQYQVQRIDN